VCGDQPQVFYFVKTGMVVRVLGVARKPNALILPPAGVSNSTVPRFPAVAAYVGFSRNDV
jgi:hypothetical protein